MLESKRITKQFGWKCFGKKKKQDTNKAMKCNAKITVR